MDSTDLESISAFLGLRDETYIKIISLGGKYFGKRKSV